MHIEPGIVEGAKIMLSYATATAALGYTAKLAADTVAEDGAAMSIIRSIAASGGSAASV